VVAFLDGGEDEVAVAAAERGGSLLVRAGSKAVGSVVRAIRGEAAGEGADAAAAAGARDLASSCLNSFPADTPVTMADGTEKPISRVKVTDKVRATDPVTGQTEARPVTALIRHSGEHTMVHLSLSNGSTITATDRHPFWDATTRTFTAAIDLRRGETVLSDNRHTLTIVDRRVYESDLTAYNLQVDGIHTYYAGATPVLVHNSCVTDVDALSQSGASVDPADAGGALTRAGRAYAKAGEVFGPTSGGPAAINEAGQSALDEILTNPGTTVQPLTKGNFTGGLRFVSPDGVLAVFGPDGTFQYFGWSTP
jgi:hypothetical protein